MARDDDSSTTACPKKKSLTNLKAGAAIYTAACRLFKAQKY
jgi:hypothetical protein